MLGIITKSILAVELGILGGIDFLTKRIPMYIILIMAVVGTALKIVDGSWYPFTWMLGMIPGGILVLICLISKEQIGLGDALIIIMLSWYIPLRTIIEIICMAFFFAGIVGIIIRIFFKKKNIQRIAFIPFIFGSYLLCLF